MMRQTSEVFAIAARMAAAFDAHPARYYPFAEIRRIGECENHTATKALRALLDARLITRRFKLAGGRCMSFYRRSNKPCLQTLQAVAKPPRIKGAVPAYRLPGGFERRFESYGRVMYYQDEDERWTARVRAVAPTLDYAVA